MTIKTTLEENYNYKNRFKGTFLHGKIEDHYGYDIFAFGRKKKFDVGVHNFTIKDKDNDDRDVTFFLWKPSDFRFTDWRGFLVFSKDEKAYSHALKCYSEKEENI